MCCHIARPFVCRCQPSPSRPASACMSPPRVRYDLVTRFAPRDPLCTLSHWQPLPTHILLGHTLALQHALSPARRLQCSSAVTHYRLLQHVPLPCPRHSSLDYCHLLAHFAAHASPHSPSANGRCHALPLSFTVVCPPSTEDTSPRSPSAHLYALCCHIAPIPSLLLTYKFLTYNHSPHCKAYCSLYRSDVYCHTLLYPLAMHLYLHSTPCHDSRQ